MDIFIKSKAFSVFKKLENYKETFGDTDNLVLRLLSDEGLDQAKRELYMRLVKKGWEKAEITAISGSSGRARGRRGGGGASNLSKLGR